MIQIEEAKRVDIVQIITETYEQIKNDKKIIIYPTLISFFLAINIILLMTSFLVSVMFVFLSFIPEDMLIESPPHFQETSITSEDFLALQN